MRIIKEDTAALIIDIQERLTPHIEGHEALLENTVKLISGLSILGIPMIITEQYPKGLGVTVPAIRELVSDLNPVEKMTFSCCDEESFIRELKQTHKQNVIVCGIETHVCVLQTTLDLISRGYQPVVIDDCVSSRKINDKLVALHRMRQEGAVISTYESILFELARVSGTEVFKKISHLVK